MPAAGPQPEDLRTEYSVIGSYTNALTSARFQTVAIYLAAIGLIVSRGKPDRLTAALILAISLGLWILDLRNRDVLWRLGERGIWIECKLWDYPIDRDSKKGGRGFFLDGRVPARFRTLTSDPVPNPFPRWFLTHAFGIDLVFLGVIGYAFVLLADANDWLKILVFLAPLTAWIVLASLLRRLSKPVANDDCPC